MLNLTATPLQNCRSTSPTSSCRSVHQLMSCRGWGPERSSTGLSISNYTALQVTDISAVVSVLCGLVTLLTPSVKKAFLVTPDLVLCHGPYDSSISLALRVRQEAEDLKCSPFGSFPCETCVVYLYGGWYLPIHRPAGFTGASHGMWLRKSQAWLHDAGSACTSAEI